MNGQELDKRMREILLAATKETGLSSVKALMELGFGPALSANMIVGVLAKKNENENPRHR